MDTTARRALGQPQPWLVLGGFLLASAAAATLGGLFSPDGGSAWYARLDKPAWTPPSWMFGVVWTALYVTMALSAWLVWRAGGADRARPWLWLYGVQLGLNALWSPLFFGARQPGLALVDIGLLWVALAVLLPRFFRASRAAGFLWVPYLAWVSYAAALNLSIFLRN